MKAIETEYRGYRFRSRLEARWAVFFDAIGAEWEYEPEGFLLDDGTRYLPDFRIRSYRGRGKRWGDDAKEIFVEIKGNMTEEDLHKIEMFSASKPIIVFGQIPDAERIEGVRSNGEPYAFWRFDFSKDGGEEYYNLVFSEGDKYWTEPKAGRGGGLVLDYPDDPYDFVDNELTAEAYRMARQARFEHGENGAKKVQTSGQQMTPAKMAKATLKELEEVDDISEVFGNVELIKARCRQTIRRQELEKEIAALQRQIVCTDSAKRTDAFKRLLIAEEELKAIRASC